MKKRVEEIFETFLIPMFNDVYESDFNNKKTAKFEAIVKESVEMFFQNYILNLPNPENTLFGHLTDKLVEEYLNTKEL